MNCLSESEANVSWLNSKGTWVTYVIMIAFLHFLLLCVLTVPLAWTLTNVINSLVSPSLALYHYHTFFLLPICGLSTNVLLQVMYLVLHCVKGTPFVEMDQGAASRLTHWEQMDEKYLQSKKFLCTVPTVL